MEPRETRHRNKSSSSLSLQKEMFRRKSMCPNTSLKNLPCSPPSAFPPNSKQLFKPHAPLSIPPEYLETRRKTFAHIEKAQNYQHSTRRLSYEKWIELKSQERRRKSLSAAHMEELGRFNEEKMRQARLERAQPFDKWKELKDREFKEKYQKEKERLRECKYKHEEEEKLKNELKEKKYNEWLQKKFEEELAEEQVKIERLRMTSTLSIKI